MKSGLIYTFRFILLLLAVCLSSTVFAANIEKLAKGKWLQLTSDNFQIITDLKEKKARILIDDLEAYRYFLIELMGMQLQPNLDPLQVLALGSGSSFKHMGLPKTWAGVFVIHPDRYYAIANVDNYSDDLKKPSFGRQVLLHEYTHFVQKYSLNRVPHPLWVQEGKAEYLGTFKFDGDKIYLGNPKAIMFRTAGLYSNAGRLQIDAESIMKTKSLPIHSTKISDRVVIDQFYARAFFIMHYINSSPELRQGLDVYLTAVKDGKNEDEALMQAFDRNFAEFEKNVTDYVLNGLWMRVLSPKAGNIIFPVPEVKVTKLDAETFKTKVGYFISE
ncbi:hypothetical protein [Cellvibrio sp. OA-2007]|uniref:hypothetical protein n=1 Tax=Cellvibrio sp. OA-2007 TaxID=529823 RepID=UPI000782A4CD|nr:hypothetical protein [Cellvibrio sp. OA-2007]